MYIGGSGVCVCVYSSPHRYLIQGKRIAVAIRATISFTHVYSSSSFIRVFVSFFIFCVRPNE